MLKKITVLSATLVAMASLLLGCGKTTESPESATERNKKLVTAFYEQAFVRKDIAGAANSYIGDTYLQHNPQVADGKAAFIEALSGYLKTKGLTIKIARVIAENELIMVHAVELIGGIPKTAVADIFRVADNKIIEHWDVQQEIPAKTASGRPMT